MNTKTTDKKPMSKTEKILNLLRNPWLNLGAVVVGIIVGVNFESLTQFLAPFGRIYIALLQMCVLPIITTAITVSVGKLFLSGKSRHYMGKLIMVFSVGIIMSSSIGTTIALVGRPGSNLTTETRVVLGEIFVSSESSHDDPAVSTGLWALLDSIVPSNIFSAFSTGQSLAIVFFSILFGIAIGSIKETSKLIIPFMEQLYTAFFKILNGALYGLPFGLICLISDQVATMGFGVILALTKLVTLFIIGALILCCIYLMILKVTTKQPWIHIFASLKEPLMIAFVVSSSVPAIPVALENMKSKLGLSEAVSNFAVPLGVIVNRQAYGLLFSLTAVFVAQLYQVELGVADIVLVILGSALAGMAAIGAPAVVAPMILYVLGPLGLPVSVGAIIFIAISPAVDNILSMTNLFSSCASASLIAVSDRKDNK